MKGCSIGLLHFKFQIKKKKKKPKLFGSIIKVSVLLKIEKKEYASATLWLHKSVIAKIIWLFF